MAGSYFKGQSQLRITLTCGVDITSGTAVIRYMKPSGTVGHWDATIETPATGVIYYDVVDETIIDEDGVWTLWPFITFSDTRVAPGESTTMTVIEEPGYETP